MLISTNNSPYVGPAAFREDQSHLFFGRDREAKKLLSLVSSERLTLFYSPSGAGKTSLIQARIIPALKKKNITVLPVARVGGDLPRKHLTVPENVYVFSAISYLARGEYSTQNLGALTRLSITEFLELELKESEKRNPFVLVFDQFEEIVTTHPEFRQQREQFFQQLQQAIAYTPYLSIILAMREDRIAGLDTYAPLLPDRLKTRFRMERLGVHSAVEAVCSPAHAAGRPFAEGVAESLVDNLREERAPGNQKVMLGEFVEPVQLQVVCLRLWASLSNRPGDRISRQDLTSFGGVDKALETFYEETIGSVAAKSEVSEKVIRLWFQRQLITPTLIRRQVNRGLGEAGGLPNEIVEELENQHLVRSETARGGVWYELVHDRLIDPILKSNRRVLRKRRKRILASASLTLLVVFVLLATSLVRVNAKKKRFAIALSHSQQALELLESHPPRSLWLARKAAVETHDHDRVVIPEARNALRQALQTTKVKLIADVQTGEVHWLGLDAHGKLLAALDQDGTLSLWEVASGRELWRPEGPLLPIVAAALSADGARLATAGDDQTVTLWDVAERHEKSTFSLGAEPVSLSLDSGGDSLAAVHWDGTVSAWDVTSRRRILSLSDSEGGYLEAVFQPGGTRLATAGPNGDVDVWEPGSVKPVLSLFNGPDPIIEFSTAGQTLFSVNSSGRFQRWDYPAGGPPWSDEPESDPSQLSQGNPYAQAMALDAKGRHVVLVAAYGEVRAWDLYSGTTADVLQGDEGVRAVAAFSRDSRRLAISKEEDRTEVWELVLEEVPELLHGHGASVHAVAFSQDGRWLASGSGDGTVRIWEAGSGETLRILDDHEKRINAVDFSSDDKFLATASDDGTAKLWDLATGTVVHTLHGHSAIVIAADFSPDGETVVTASLDGTARMWNVLSGEALFAVAENDGGLYSVAFEPNGKWFATGGPDGLVKLREAADGRERRRFKNATDTVISLTFSPDGKRLAAASKDGRVTVREIASDSSQVLAGHLGWVQGVAFSPDGRWLASCDAAAWIVWDLRSGSPALNVPSQTALHDVAFHPDGEQLATAGKDAVIRLEPLDDHRLLRLAQERVGLEPR